ncbi:hypothetical protein [Haloferax sp. DFSO52]|uniref:hypothetical protein n=1 Tax=Haloferax sp. DFSO52 TaxID=3388505 RepID=UPI003A87637A
MTDTTPVELGQKPTLAKSFEDISNAHRTARQTVEQAVEKLSSNEDPTPPSIRGPLRSGKTALQYHTFGYAWEHGVPALYVEAKELLREFERADVESFGDWVDERAQEQVAALLQGDLHAVDWLPNDSPTNLEDWFESIPASTVTERVILLVDEVEQKYTEFLSATGVDDNNPLRNLLDQGRLFPVISMGQISAMEFVGFADLKRTDSVSIPPVTISNIRGLLEKRGTDPALDRVAFWLTRGRAAHVHQVVTDAHRIDVTTEDPASLTRWMATHADERSAEFRTVRRVWEHREIEDPEAAATSVAFGVDGYDDWLVESETWYPADELVDVVDAIVRETDRFTSQDEEADATHEARQIVRESTERVIDGIAVGPRDGPSDTLRAVPSGWLTGTHDDRSESRAFLSLVQDFVLSFEADRPARNIAFDALEDAKARFKQNYDTKVATVAAENGHAWTLLPSVIEEAYPPLATEPSRLTGKQTDDLIESWEGGGLELSVDAAATVYACPTEASFRTQLEQQSPDPTHPVVVLVDDAVDVDSVLDSVPVAAALERHSALSIVPVPTARVWTFVVQLSALLESKLGDAHTATTDQIEALLDTPLRREQRTTIETLYKHLTTRVAGEAATASVENHRQQFTTGGHYVWAHPGLASTSFLNPRGGSTNGRHSVLGLLALGREPDWDDPHGRLLGAIRDGMNEDIIATTSGFDYKELLNYLTASGEYRKAIRDIRRVCRDDTDTLIPAVTRVMNAFEEIIEASAYDRETLLSGLFDQESTKGNTSADRAREFVKSLSPTEADDTTDDVLWALVTASLARTDTAYVKETLGGTEERFDDHVQTLDGYLNDITRAQRLLSTGGGDGGGDESNGAVATSFESEFDSLFKEIERQSGTAADSDTETDVDAVETRPVLGVTLDTTHIETYRENIVAIRDDLRDAKSHATTTDFKPTGYALAVIAARYENVVRDAIHEIQRATPSSSDLNHVKNLSSTVRALQATLEDDDIDLSTDKRAGVDAFVEDLFDFQSVVGQRLTVGNPEDESMDKIAEINTAARIRTAQVEDLTEDLDELAGLQQRVSKESKSARRELKALVTLLTKPEVDIEDETEASEIPLADGQGDAGDTGEEQRASGADQTDTNANTDTEETA